MSLQVSQVQDFFVRILDRHFNVLSGKIVSVYHYFFWVMADLVTFKN